MRKYISPPLVCTSTSKGVRGRVEFAGILTVIVVDTQRWQIISHQPFSYLATLSNA